MAAHALQPIISTERKPRPAARRTPKAVRRARTLTVLFLLLVAALLLLFPRVVHTQGHPAPPAGQEYIVAAGDTLWEIAAQHAGRRDVREVLFLIEQANDLSSAEIQPGQVLWIPAVPGSKLAGR
ncbi:MAG: LysM peptidoglycan-binding domain-containing protein [Bacillota bacterium]